MDGEGLVLRAARGDHAVGSCSVSDGPVTIGCWSGATLRLDDAALLPVHAVLDPEGDGHWRVISIAPDGVRVKGRNVRRAVVGPGDRIAVGPYEIVLDASGARVAAAAAVAAGLVRQVVHGSSEPVRAPAGGERPLRATLAWKGSPLEVRVIAPGSLLTLGAGRGAAIGLPEALLPGDGNGWVAAACLGGTWHVALDTPWRAVDATRTAHPLLSAALRTDGPEAPRGFHVAQTWTVLAPGARVRLDGGDLALELERCDEFAVERVPRTPWWVRPEGQSAVIAALVGLFVFALLRIPVEFPFFPQEQVLQRQSEAVARFQRPPPPAPRLPPVRPDSSGKDEKVSARARGEEGQAGRHNATTSGRRAGPKSDAEIVKQAALLRALEASGLDGKVQSGGALAAASALGSLTGSAPGDARGVGGLGLRGAGAGGGGVSTDTVGVGPVGARGGGAGAQGAGRLGRGGHSDLSLDEPARVEGGLDREVIRRVILSHRAQIRYCYEKELTHHPTLAGKLLVEFVIGADGRVTTARSAQNTLESAAVAGCIESKVRGWLFPKPRGGGVVVVSYPFLFKPTGQGGS